MAQTRLAVLVLAGLVCREVPFGRGEHAEQGEALFPIPVAVFFGAHAHDGRERGVPRGREKIIPELADVLSLAAGLGCVCV